MSVESRGTTKADLTLNIDLAPTILSAAGIEVPEFMQGRDISDLYLHTNNTGGGGEGVSPPWRTDFLYEHQSLTARSTFRRRKHWYEKTSSTLNGPITMRRSYLICEVIQGKSTTLSMTQTTRRTSIVSKLDLTNSKSRQHPSI
eukprot:scaffold78745_cov41-Attheya_sp.AAC.1